MKTSRYPYHICTPRNHKWFFGYSIMPGGEGYNI